MPRGSVDLGLLCVDSEKTVPVSDQCLKTFPHNMMSIVIDICK